MNDRNKNESVALLALSSIKGVGYWSLYSMAASGISFSEIIKADSPELLQEFCKGKACIDEEWNIFQVACWNSGIVKLKKLHYSGVKVIFHWDEKFPHRLNSIKDQPYWIFVQGDDRLLREDNIISIVGTRKPSEDGIFLTHFVMASIADLDVVTVSGLANGIDQLVHSDSVRYGIKTVAVLGNGIFNDYPKGSEPLRKRILDEGGAIISEYLPHDTYSAENFVRRNRIQAALCKSLIPVEWKIKSGTAHTVNFANNYKKSIVNVYLPGSFYERQELTFAKKERGASAWMVPQEIESFLNALTENIEIENISAVQTELGF